MCATSVAAPAAGQQPAPHPAGWLHAATKPNPAQRPPDTPAPRWSPAAPAAHPTQAIRAIHLPEAYRADSGKRADRWRQDRHIVHIDELRDAQEQPDSEQSPAPERVALLLARQPPGQPNRTAATLLRRLHGAPP